MVSWFIAKGVTPFAKHRDAPISGLHLFAARVAYPGDYFGHESSSLSISPHHIRQLQQDEGCRRDSCSCLCSIEGCTPLTTVAKHAGWGNLQSQADYARIKAQLQVWHDKMLYQLEQDQDHLEQLLRAIHYFQKIAFKAHLQQN